MELILIRHGQTTSNHAGIHQGWNNVSLSEQGKMQAEITAEFLKNFMLDKIYSSDLERTRETAGIVFSYRKADIIYDTRLREINVGSLAGIYIKDAEETYGAPYLQHRNNFDYSSYQGESRDELLERTRSFLEDVAKSDEKKIAAVTHGGTIRAILSNVLDTPVFRRFEVANCSITRLKYSECAWRIASVNNTQHLYHNL